MNTSTPIYKKPSFLIALPFVVLMAWLVFYLILIGSGAIASVPSLDTDLMSPSQLDKYKADQQSSEMWTNIWTTGIIIIVIGGIISFITGVLKLRKSKRA